MRLINTRIQVALALAVAAIIAPQNAWAVGETNGRLGGTVTEAQTGAPVPGATVTVSGGSLIGGPRTQTTGDDGRYDFVELPPGSYNVEVSYSGVKPIRRRIVVRQGELAPLDIAWSAELAEAEVTVVVEERHLTKPDTTMSGTVISNDTQAKIASGRTYQGVTQQVAGVSGGANPNVKGSDYQSNKYMVDGLDITDPISSTFSANINFDSISSVEVITGGMEAQYNALGGVINLITNGGSDEWHVDASLYVNNAKFSVQEQLGPNVYDRSVPRNRLNVPPTQSYQANVNVGGPILKHRLWFNVSLEYDYTQSSTPAGPPLNLQAPSRLFQSVYARAKIVWAPNEKHRISLSVSTDPTTISNTNTGTAANRRLATAQSYRQQGGTFGILQWDWFLNNNINTQLQAGYTYQYLNDGSQGYFTGVDLTGDELMFSPTAQHYDFNTPQHVNNLDNTVWYQGNTPSFDSRYSIQIDPSISLRGRAGGSHDAKIGIQTRLLRSTFDVRNPGGGVSFADNSPSGNIPGVPPFTSGGTGEMGLCDETTGRGCFQKTITSDYHQSYEMITLGGYIQDRWKPWKRITVLPGIRFDWGGSHNNQGVTASNLFGVGPRIGFTLDLTGDQKTIFSAFYGRANDVGNMAPAFLTSNYPITQSFFWNSTSKAFDINAGASGGSKGLVVDTTSTTPPHTDEVTASIRREVFLNSVAGIEYTYKHIANMWEVAEINQIWDPSGYRVIGYADQSNPQKVFTVTTNHNLVREYQGLDFWVEARPTDHWDLYASYTLSFLYGTGGDAVFDQQAGVGAPLYNPRQTRFTDGFLGDDTRHNLKLRVGYNTHGFNVGGFFNYQSGLPLSKGFFQSFDGDYVNLRSPTGTDPFAKNNPRGFADFRLPDTVVLNLRVSYDFHALIKQHLILIADLFNMFNLRTPTSLTTEDVPQFGQVGARQQPFRFQLGLRYVY